MSATEMDFFDNEQDFLAVSDSELSLFEEECELFDGGRPSFVPVDKIGSSNNLSQKDVGANMTFISKAVYNLVSNIFKCPVSEETLKRNIALTAPKVPFLNVRPVDPWFKSVNPTLLPECLESELITQKFMPNFLRVAFPLVSLLDAMSKGRLTQSRIETSITDSLLLLSSALENVNSWRRDSLMRRYNLGHLKSPDVSPAENPYLFPQYFEKCAKYPTVEDLYQASETLPDLEINSTAKFANEAVSGDSNAGQLDSKVQKLIRDTYLLQTMGKDSFTQTVDEIKSKLSVGSQIKTCKCAVLGSPASNVQDKGVITDSVVKLGAVNLKPVKTGTQGSGSLVANSSNNQNVQNRTLGQSADAKFGAPTKSASPDISVVDASKPDDCSTKLLLLNKESASKNKASGNTDFSEDIFEVVTPGAADSNNTDLNISSGITIEDESEDVEIEGDNSKNAANELESEIVILEVLDDADDKESSTLVQNEAGSASQRSLAPKRKIVPITGPSPSPPTSKLGVISQQPNVRTVTSLNPIKLPVRTLGGTPPVENQNLASSSFSNLSKHTKPALNTRNVTRVVAPAPVAIRVQGGNKNQNQSATAFQTAAAMVGIGNNSQQQMSSGARIVRATGDSFGSISQQNQNIPAKRTRQDPQWSAMEFGGGVGGRGGVHQQQQMPQQGGGGMGMWSQQQNQQGIQNQFNQQIGGRGGMGGNFPRRNNNNNRRGGGMF
ncbi:uncharacterized protein LOC134840735 isoform X2 [Symsagittifera roscoffensis]|uniref:uncharacterized protein LOC134840735 isoform X2 n=1 Tax=Symsagittifera roscoffensis TaxID=84072 RepID=UPI00307BDC0F